MFFSDNFFDRDDEIGKRIDQSLQDGFDPLGARLLTGTGWQVEPVCSEHIIQQLEVMGSYSFVKRS
jgi:hypothetical protein